MSYRSSIETDARKVFPTTNAKSNKLPVNTTHNGAILLYVYMHVFLLPSKHNKSGQASNVTIVLSINIGEHSVFSLCQDISSCI
jgi:hypothetical protein